jgi:hypothetical protein
MVAILQILGYNNPMGRNGKQTQRLPLAVDTTAVDLGSLKAKEDSPFRYLVKGERPRLDGAFFELLLSRVLLESGGLSNFDTEWPRGVQALSGLNLTRLAHLSPAELADAISSVGGEFSSRLERRADDLQVWADAFWRIRQIYGSFRQYVRSFDTDGHDALIEDLKQRLVGLSPDFLDRFLRESGEKPLPVAQPERSRAPQAKKPKQPQAQVRPAAQLAEGNRRQQPPRDNSTNKTPAPPSQGTSPKAQSGENERTGSKGRHRRRGFFRRRRGGRGDGAQGTPAQPSATGQA